ncbi:MAG: hypothetical protein ACE5FO_10940 [Parvularculaceae bacterium]
MKNWLGVLVLAASTTIAQAQEQAQETDIEGAVAACGSITNREARLDCFDSLANAVAETADEESAATAPETVSPIAQPETPRPDDGVEPPGRVAPLTPPIAPDPAGERPSIDKKTPKSRDAEKEREFLIIPKKEKPKKRKPEKRQKKQPSSSPFTAKIAKIWLYEGKIYIQLDNGEIWKQTSIRRPQLPEAGQSVEFSKRRFGGWFARFEGQSMKIGMTRVGG